MTSLYLRMRGRAGRVRARLASRRRSLQERLDVPALHVPRSGRAPVVERETTHLGPEVDDAVFAAKRRMRLGADPDYDLLYEHFDVLHYLLQSPELLDQPDVDLIEHFLEHGFDERLSPDPDFSMGEYVARYRRKCTEGRERSPYLIWLKRGKVAGDIADPAPGIMRMSLRARDAPPAARRPARRASTQSAAEVPHRDPGRDAREGRRRSNR